MQRSLGKYQQTCEVLLWEISADLPNSVGKYKHTCKNLQRANISRCAKIIGQISEDLRISFYKYQVCLCKYQKMFEDLWVDISRHVKIYGHRVVWAQNTITTLCSTSDTTWLSLIDQFYWKRESVDLNFALLQLFCYSHLISADLACLYLSFLNFKVSLCKHKLLGETLHKF